MRLITLTLLLVISYPVSARACSCVYPEAPGKPGPYTLEEKFNFHEKIFCGIVVEIRGDRQTGKREVTFEVIKAFKGEVPARYTITDDRIGTCTNSFAFANAYLVWDSGNICTPTKPARDAKDDLMKILKIKGIAPEDFIGKRAFDEWKKAQAEEGFVLPEQQTIEYYVEQVCEGRHATP